MTNVKMKMIVHMRGDKFMRMSNNGAHNYNKEIKIQKFRNELEITITQEDNWGNINIILGMTLSREQSLQLASYILTNFK